MWILIEVLPVFRITTTLPNNLAASFQGARTCQTSLALCTQSPRGAFKLNNTPSSFDVFPIHDFQKLQAQRRFFATDTEPIVFAAIAYETLIFGMEDTRHTIMARKFYSRPTAKQPKGKETRQ